MKVVSIEDFKKKQELAQSLIRLSAGQMTKQEFEQKHAKHVKKTKEG